MGIQEPSTAQMEKWQGHIGNWQTLCETETEAEAIVNEITCISSFQEYNLEIISERNQW